MSVLRYYIRNTKVSKDEIDLFLIERFLIYFFVKKITSIKNQKSKITQFHSKNTVEP